MDRRDLRYSEEWLPEAMIDALITERAVEPEMSDEEYARLILMRSAPKAAQSVAWLSMYSNNEQIRLKASQFILDGVLTGNFKGSGGEDDVLANLVQQLIANDIPARERL